jgi:hypothetical protein
MRGGYFLSSSPEPLICWSTVLGLLLYRRLPLPEICAFSASEAMTSALPLPEI